MGQRPDDAVALFVAKLPLNSGVDQHLVRKGGAERSVTFTASGSGFYYVEVSDAPGVTSNYTLTSTEN